MSAQDAADHIEDPPPTREQVETNEHVFFLSTVGISTEVLERSEFSVENAIKLGSPIPTNASVNTYLQTTGIQEPSSESSFCFIHEAVQSSCASLKEPKQLFCTQFLTMQAFCLSAYLIKERIAVSTLAFGPKYYDLVQSALLSLNLQERFDGAAGTSACHS
jgi:hypothetical protein